MVTVDVETDFGGRTQGDLGIKFGIPKILQLLKRYHIKGLFFISTELLSSYKSDIKKILDEGHDLGSHGHFHVVWKDKWRAEEDKRISKTLLTALTGKDRLYYRAPKFSYDDSSIYANDKESTGLLKHMWFGEKVKDILYLHPFDIVKDNHEAPNTFCRIWYSRPVDALNTLEDILSKVGKGSINSHD